MLHHIASNPPYLGACHAREHIKGTAAASCQACTSAASLALPLGKPAYPLLRMEALRPKPQSQLATCHRRCGSQCVRVYLHSPTMLRMDTTAANMQTEQQESPRKFVFCNDWDCGSSICQEEACQLQHHLRYAGWYKPGVHPIWHRPTLQRQGCIICDLACSGSSAGTRCTPGCRCFSARTLHHCLSSIGKVNADKHVADNLLLR